MPTRSPRVAGSRPATGAACAGLVLLGACAAPERPRESGPPPRRIEPARVSLISQNFQDTDKNGFADTAPVFFYVFGNDPNYHSPLEAEGALEFILSTMEGERIATWSLGPEEAASARTRTAVGPAFVLELDLRKAGAERSAVREGVLVGRLTTPDGRTISSREGPAVSLGRVR